MQARVVSPSPGAARRRAGAQRYKRGVRGRGIRLRARLPGERSSKTPPVAIASREKRGAPTCPAALRLLLSPDNIWLLSYGHWSATRRRRRGGGEEKKKHPCRVAWRPGPYADMPRRDMCSATGGALRVYYGALMPVRLPHTFRPFFLI
jgi:hypothetical protein